MRRQGREAQPNRSSVSLLVGCLHPDYISSQLSSWLSERAQGKAHVPVLVAASRNDWRQVCMDAQGMDIRLLVTHP